MSILTVGIVIYIIVIYESYKNSTGVFAPYVSSPPENSCKPLIAVRKLTPEEQAKRAQILSNAPAKGSPIPCNITPTSLLV
jgi:hypothetical protein